MATVHPSLQNQELKECVALLKAYAKKKDLKKGISLHEDIVKKGLLQINPFLLGSSLVSMYAKCGSLDKAQIMLHELSVRDTVTWCELISGYTHQRQGHQAFDCFYRMQNEGTSPDSITFICILKACGSMGYLHKGQQIHSEIVNNGMLGKSTILGTSLMDMYAKCGDLRKAQEVFNEVPIHDVVSWTALMVGHVQHDHIHGALECFERMQCESVAPNEVAFTCVLKACSSTRANDKGLRIHAMIVKDGLPGEKQNSIGNALVDMYAKLGALVKAQQVFNTLQVHDVVSWNALMTGYNHFGEIENVFHLFDKMLEEGTEPDSVTFIVILNACSRMGLWYKGEMYFQAMTKDYGIIPIIDHHACMIDLLSRAGQLDKAYGMIEKLPICPNVVVWHTILGACKSFYIFREDQSWGYGERLVH